MLELLLELRRVAQLNGLAVDACARKALTLKLLEQVLVLALAAAHDRREHLVAGALRQREHRVDDLLRRLRPHLFAAHGAVLDADARPQQAQVVVDLGDGANGGTRVAVGGLLVDRDGRRKPLDEVDVWLVHLAKELARVGAQRLDVAPLPLRKDGVERERRLARAAEAAEDDERVAGKVKVNALEVVFARAADDETVIHTATLRGNSFERMFESPGVRRDDLVERAAMCATSRRHPRGAAAVIEVVRSQRERRGIAGVLHRTTTCAPRRPAHSSKLAIMRVGWSAILGRATHPGLATPRRMGRSSRTSSSDLPMCPTRARWTPARARSAL